MGGEKEKIWESSRVHWQKGRHTFNKLEALFWVVGAITAIYYTNFVKVMFSHKGVNKYSSVKKGSFSTCSCWLLGWTQWLELTLESFSRWEESKWTMRTISVKEWRMSLLLVEFFPSWGILFFMLASLLQFGSVGGSGPLEYCSWSFSDTLTLPISSQTTNSDLFCLVWLFSSSAFPQVWLTMKDISTMNTKKTKIT